MEQAPAPEWPYCELSDNQLCEKAEIFGGRIIMAMEPNYVPDPGDWVCARCQCPLEQVKVQVGYLGSAFDVSLPRCPSCGLTMIPKSLAEGKMAEVEALLEDK